VKICILELTESKNFGRQERKW